MVSRPATTMRTSGGSMVAWSHTRYASEQAAPQADKLMRAEPEHDGVVNVQVGRDFVDDRHGTVL